MSELQRLLDEEVFPYELNPEFERVVNVRVVWAARKYANPDYEAAADAYNSEMTRIDPGNRIYLVEMRAIHAAVDAALGITEDT